MKKDYIIRLILSFTLVITLAFCGTTYAFAEDDLIEQKLNAIENESQILDLEIVLSELEDNDMIFYGILNSDNKILITSNEFAKGNAVFVGGLTMNSWSGSNINFDISVRAVGTSMYAHAGQIVINSVTSSGGLGTLYNSMTFAITSTTPKSKLSKTFNMNVGSLDKIYITLTNLTVTDSDRAVTPLTQTSRKFLKSNYQ